MRMDGTLESLQPHMNLEKLEINWYRGIQLPDWILSLSNLTELNLTFLGQCLQLPALGKLASLEVLMLFSLESVKQLGSEFYGVDETHDIHNISNSEEVVIFPKLKKFELCYMTSLEKWDLSLQNRVDLFPNLRELRLFELQNFRVLPALGKLIMSLETLKLSIMDGFLSFHEFFLGSLMNDDRSGEVFVFLALKYLSLYEMSCWEEKEVVLRNEKEEEGCNTNNGTTIMPCLSKLEIQYCRKLKVIAFYMFSHALKDLKIHECPQLMTGLQPSLPPLLEKLTLEEDVGVLKSSLPLLHNNNYPNLHYFEISYSSQSSLPQGFNLFTSIRKLVFCDCKFLHFGPDDLKHLTMLTPLEIYDCPVLGERFREQAEISRSSSYVYNISIWPELTNVHTGIVCDNCEMDPTVGKRYKCKVCYDEISGGFDLCENCYNTPSKHTDLVNQHNRNGHTFELIAYRYPIANREDSSDPDDSS